MIFFLVAAVQLGDKSSGEERGSGTQFISVVQAPPEGQQTASGDPVLLPLSLRGGPEGGQSGQGVWGETDVGRVLRTKQFR